MNFLLDRRELQEFGDLGIEKSLQTGPCLGAFGRHSGIQKSPVPSEQLAKEYRGTPSVPLCQSFRVLK